MNKVLILLINVIILILSSCADQNKEIFTGVFVEGDLPVPSLTTTPVTNITATSATCGGNITSDGGKAVTARGVVWSTTQNPTVSLSTKTSDGTGSGIFTSSITGLIPSTTYYVRAYATNGVGTAYGNQISFVATVTTKVNTVTSPTGKVWLDRNL
jgi:hypothetical protein